MSVYDSAEKTPTKLQESPEVIETLPNLMNREAEKPDILKQSPHGQSSIKAVEPKSTLPAKLLPVMETESIREESKSDIKDGTPMLSTVAKRKIVINQHQTTTSQYRR